MAPRRTPSRPPSRRRPTSTATATRPPARRAKAAKPAAGRPSQPKRAAGPEASRPPAKRSRPPAKRSRPAKRSASSSRARTADRRALGRVDGARGERDGKAVQHKARTRARRRLVGALAFTVLAVGVLFAAISPLTSWWEQRSDTAATQEELQEIRAERERVQAETERLTTPEEIEKQARAELGFQRPGEETYNHLPAQLEPIGLPETWPFTGVERTIGAG